MTTPTPEHEKTPATGPVAGALNSHVVAEADPYDTTRLDTAAVLAAAHERYLDGTADAAAVSLLTEFRPYHFTPAQIACNDLSADAEEDTTPPARPAATGAAGARGAAPAEELEPYVSKRVTGTELDAQTFPPLRWSVPGLIPEGYGMIVAPPKAGKSWFVAGIGLAVAAGGRALGTVPVEPRPVLYLALEDGPRRLQDRYRKIMDGHPIPAAMNSVTGPVTPREAWEEIRAFMREHADACPLVIVDTYQKVAPAKSPSAGAYEHDYLIGSRFKEVVAAVPGATLLVVHHTNKGTHDDFQDAVSGTQGIAGAADFTMVLARRRKSDRAVLSITGRDVQENEYALTTDAGLWSLDGDTLMEATERVAAVRTEEQQAGAMSRSSDRTLEVIAHVRASGAEVGPRDIADALPEMSANAAGVYLSRAAERGLIEKIGRGRYRALSKGGVL